MTLAAHVIADRPIAAGVAAPLENFTIRIGGELVTDYYVPGSCSIEDKISARTGAAFRLLDITGGTTRAFTVPIGARVIIRNRNGLLFTGTVDSVQEAIPGPLTSKVINHTVRCVDFAQILDRRKISRVFEDTGQTTTQTAGSIIRTIFTEFLEIEDMTLGVVEDGPLIKKVSASFISLSQFLDRVVDVTGGAFVWYVDAARAINFHARAMFTAPWSITPADADIETFTLSRSRRGYANRQFIVGPSDTSEERTEEFRADGKKRSYTLTLPVAEKPRIKINGTEVDPDDIGLQSGGTTPWEFAIGSRNVSQNSDEGEIGGPVIIFGRNIDFIYRGLSPIVMVSDDEAAIAERKSVEGGTGIYEDIDDDDSLSASVDASDKAETLLEMKAEIPNRCKFTTTKAGLRAGMLIQVQLTEFGVNGPFLVQSVRSKDMGGDLQDTKMRAQVEITDGKRVMEHIRFFRDLVLGARPFEITANSLVVLPTITKDDLTIAEVTSSTLGNSLLGWELDPFTHTILGSSQLPRQVVIGTEERFIGPTIGLPVEI